MKKQQICILGSTGSIGTQALDVIEQHSDLYEVYCLTANNRVKELAQQARKFKPAAVVIANEAHYDELKDLLSDEPDIKVYAGAQALCDIVEADPIDMVLASMVGFSGISCAHPAGRQRAQCHLPELSGRGRQRDRQDIAHLLGRTFPPSHHGAVG